MAIDLLDPGIGDVPPNNAFKRPVRPFTSARGQRAPYCAPCARWKALRPAAQRER